MDDGIMKEARHCQVCKINHGDDDPIHNNTSLHRFNFLLFEWSKYKIALGKDRHGVNVAVSLQRQNGYVYNFQENPNKGKSTLKITPQVLTSHQNSLTFPCKVSNNRKDSILLTSCTILHCYPLFSLRDPNKNLENGKVVNLEPGTEYTVIVEFSSRDKVLLGTYKIPVYFTFQTTGKQLDTFSIGRSIDISVEEEVAVEEDQEKSPFRGKEWQHYVQIYPPTRHLWFVDTYTIPSMYLRCIKYGLQEWHNMSEEDYQVLLDLRRLVKPGYVTSENYKDFWKVILWLEEMGRILGLQRYNMENVKLTYPGTGFLELVVPGLAEKRPSVIVGDMIDMRMHADHTGYRGIIKRVNDMTVEIGDINHQLVYTVQSNPAVEIDVKFILSRLCFERMHQGVEQVCINEMMPSLFPDISLRERSIPECRTINSEGFYNRKIVSNPEQRTAVHKILNAASGIAPYIVFGPPGTGKTITIVEAILQIKAKTNKNILVCAPANAACDMLTEKLMMHCRKNELIRIISANVDRGNINKAILGYSNFDKPDAVRKIWAEELVKYRVVVTTLVLVGRYTSQYHPDVVFIDEAAQACEPEAMIAIGMLEKGKQIVLAGDPRQLGPSMSSSVAKKYNLGISLLERLMELELYKTGDQNFITMLKQNFRSHSTILRLPNELFYGGQLQPVSAKAENDPLAKVFVFGEIQVDIFFQKRSNAKCRGEAVEFCSVISKESRQGRSPSYFNQVEVLMVLKYVQALTAHKFENENDRVLPEQIGVVTPYIRQVYKVKEILKQNNFQGVEVGTTETFQGREKRVILITTVRAQKDLLLHDKKYNLGFVRNEKRFNVAVTRSMSKLIVIGCAHVLGSDKNWLSYIELCEELGSFCNAPYARRTNDVINDITNRFRNVKMIDTQLNH